MFGSLASSNCGYYAYPIKFEQIFPRMKADKYGKRIVVWCV